MADYNSYGSKAYDPYEEQYAKQYGIPVEMLRAIRVGGEKSNADQVSSAGARGVFQFTPQTRQGFMKNYNIDPWAGPEQNTQAGALHLANDWKRSNGNVDETVMSYIAGPSGKRRGPITRAYLGRVKNTMKGLGYGATPVEEDDESGTGDDTGGGFAVAPGGAQASFAARGARPDALSVLSDSQNSVSKLYDDAMSRLEQHYRGPDTSELLLSLGAAMLQPTENGRFMDAVANASKVLPEWAKSRREGKNALTEATLAFQMKKAEALAGLQEKYITGSMKAPAMEIGTNPVSGALFNKRTGFPVPNVNHINLLLQNQDKAGDFDLKFGPGAAAAALAQYGTGAQ